MLAVLPRRGVELPRFFWPIPATLSLLWNLPPGPVPPLLPGGGGVGGGLPLGSFPLTPAEVTLGGEYRLWP